MPLEDEVADILQQQTQVTISNWLARVDAETDIITVQLSAEERCAHLPEMFRDLVSRLRNPLPLGTRALMSDAADDHGSLRREQGYSAAMMVEESRMLQVSIFETLKLHVGTMDARDLMGDVMCQGRSKTRPLWRSKSRPVDRCEVVGYAG